MKLYVFGKSIKQINELLAAGKPVWGVNIPEHGEDGGDYKLDSTLRSGTVIVVYERHIEGMPLGRHYGTWQKDKVA